MLDRWRIRMECSIAEFPGPCRRFAQQERETRATSPERHCALSWQPFPFVLTSMNQQSRREGSRDYRSFVIGARARTDTKLRFHNRLGEALRGVRVFLRRSFGGGCAATRKEARCRVLIIRTQRPLDAGQTAAGASKSLFATQNRTAAFVMRLMGEMLLADSLPERPTRDAASSPSR